jgi:hypothetical protein|mmetsp:Transcript_80654/g.125673  ORF Transcript_80654/g.125673 Transcript_80654/m.125673 type:complete len:281 (-) Transcript_80654:97-939(-)
MMSLPSASKAATMPPAQVLVAYGAFTLGSFAVWHLVADGEFSAILTLSVMLQTLALALLAIQVLLSGGVTGISAKTLVMDALALCCRLSSTLWLNGYLPVDASGDYMYQVFDIVSVGILAWLLREMFTVRSRTYQAEEDSFPMSPLVLGAFVLAAVMHGNMNNRPVFDSLWMAGLFLSAIAVLPQLWLITRTGGRVESLMSHHIAAMAASSVLSGIFMWHARHDITCHPWFGEFNHAIFAILSAHLLHLVLLGDFAYYYIKAVITKGFDCRLEILEDCGV